MASLNQDVTPKLLELQQEVVPDAKVIVALFSGDRFVIGRKPGEQPHHFDVAASFTLEPAARVHTVEITINVEP